MFKNLKPVIAIDGTAGSGKGTLAKKVARSLNFDHLDSGKLYRYLAYLEFKENKKVKDILKQKDKINFSEINSIDLRTEEISNNASVLAKEKNVRDFLTKVQRDFACFPPSKNGSVIDGRDIGSIIIPNAEVKFYIDASTEVRTQRRLKEIKLKNKADILSYDEIYKQILARDQRDKNRRESPLKKTENSILIDTSFLSPEEVVDTALIKIRSILDNIPIKHCT